MSIDPRPENTKRRRYLLDPAWQLSAFRNVALVALAAGVAQMVGLYFLWSRGPFEPGSGPQVGLVAFLVSALFLALVFLALWIVAVRFTHSVVGPARVIKKAIDGLARGEYDHRLTLREGDYLKDLAASVVELRGQVQARDETARELVETLARGDHKRALELARSLPGRKPKVREERTRTAA